MLRLRGADTPRTQLRFATDRRSNEHADAAAAPFAPGDRPRIHTGRRLHGHTAAAARPTIRRPSRCRRRGRKPHFVVIGFHFARRIVFHRSGIDILPSRYFTQHYDGERWRCLRLIFWPAAPSRYATCYRRRLTTRAESCAKKESIAYTYSACVTRDAYAELSGRAFSPTHAI